MGTKLIQKGIPNCPKWIPNGSLRGSPESLRTPKWILHVFLVIPDRFGSRFGASGIQRGSQNAAFGDQFSIRGVKNGVPEGDREKVRKFRGNKLPQWVFLGRLQPWKSCSRVGAVHILLKRVVAEMVTWSQMIPNGPKGVPKGPKISVFGEATTSKIVLPCRRRAYKKNI